MVGGSSKMMATFTAPNTGVDSNKQDVKVVVNNVGEQIKMSIHLRCRVPAVPSFGFHHALFRSGVRNRGAREIKIHAHSCSFTR